MRKLTYILLSTTLILIAGGRANAQNSDCDVIQDAGARSRCLIARQVVATEPRTHTPRRVVRRYPSRR
jgi:hypothetical protein